MGWRIDKDVPEEPTRVFEIVVNNNPVDEEKLRDGEEVLEEGEFGLECCIQCDKFCEDVRFGEFVEEGDGIGVGKREVVEERVE
jgi:hypothetical protein